MGPTIACSAGVLVLAVVGVATYFDRTTGEWAGVYNDINRAIGTGMTLYASLWLAIGGYRWAVSRRSAAVSTVA